MGIDVFTSASLPRSGPGQRPAPRDELFARIVAAADAFTTDDILRRLFRSDTHEHSLYLTLHPAATPLEFTWNPDQTIDAGVRTSSAGPGFHAYAVDMLKHIGRECGLEWNWEEQADETDYARSDSFQAVQEAMLAHLRLLAGMIEEHGPKPGDDTTMALHWPLDGPTVLEAEYAVSPSGPWPREWWDRLRASEDARPFAMEFYPWWNREPDALFREQLGRMLLWSEVHWHPPEDEQEEELYKLAIDCLDTQDSIPEVAELQRLLDHDEEEDELPMPSPTGIGFYRRRLRFRFTPTWSVVLPGYFYSQVHEDGGGIAFGYGMREVHLTTYTMGEDDDVPSASQILSENAEAPEGADIFEHEEDGVLGRGHISLEKDDEGDDLWVLQGIVAADGTAALCTVTFADPEDREWALETFRSLQCSGRPSEE